MAKTASELRQIAKSLNIPTENKSVSQLEFAIGKKLWEQENPGTEMPLQISPMLINEITSKGKEFVDREITKDKYILQHKLNGERLIFQLFPDNRTYLTTRARSVKTFRYTELEDRILGLQNLKSPFDEGVTILDGEAIMELPEITLPSGIETKSTLQSTTAIMHMERSKALEVQRKYQSITFKVFDILYLNGRDVQNLSYDERSKLVVTAVDSILKLNPSASLEAVPVISDYESAWDLFEDYVSEGGEGLVAKLRTAPYEQGKRVKTQLKLKQFQTIDAFVTGYVDSDENKSLRNYIGGLIFSTHIDGAEYEIAAVSNLDMETRRQATTIINGKPVLKESWYGKCFELLGQGFNKKSLRLQGARISEERQDKNPEDCNLDINEIKFI